jgi:hypothetical protein
VVARVGDEQDVGGAGDRVRPAQAASRRRAAAVVAARRRVVLAEHDVGRPARLEPTAPAQHALVAGVGDPRPAGDVGEAEGPVEGGAVAGPAAVRLDLLGVVLPDDDRRRGVGAGRDAVVHEHPVVPGVGDVQVAVHDADPGGQPHAVGRAASARRRSFGGRVGLAEHDVRGGAVGVRQPVPDEHPVVAGVGHHEHVAGDVHAAGRVQLRRGRGRVRQAEAAG